jgi:non-homologous end joining protein Ku
MVDAVSGEPVEHEEIRRGYEVEDGVVVAFQKRALAALRGRGARGRSGGR